MAVTDGDCVNECDECDVGEGLLCVAKRCSISCSCCSALTKAVFSRFVCSAFNAFFTFDVTHCSQIIFESLPTVQGIINRLNHVDQLIRKKKYRCDFERCIQLIGLTWRILKGSVDSFALFFPFP